MKTNKSRIERARYISIPESQAPEAAELMLSGIMNDRVRGRVPVGPPTIKTGCSADDFMLGRISVIVKVCYFKVPRIISDYRYGAAPRLRKRFVTKFH